MPTPENEQKIRYLSRYRRLNQRINRLLEEQSRWREKAMRITPVLSPVPGGGGSGSPIERPMEKVIAMEGDINAAIDLIDEFDNLTFAVLKHNNACGLASRPVLVDAWKAALAGDRGQFPGLFDRRAFLSI